MNNVVLAGRLSSDTELKTTSSGKEYVKFGLAVKRDFAKDGQQDCDFINITAWGKTAVFVNQYFSKGDGIVLSGKIQTGSYTDNNGNKRYTTEVMADRVEFPQGKKGTGNSQNTTNYDYTPNAPTANTPQNNSVPIPESGNTQELPLDDDLPFN